MSRIVPENPKIWREGFTYDRTDQLRYKTLALYQKMRFRGREKFED